VDRPGEGFGSRLLAATLDLAFGDLGLHRLDLMVFTDNERALRAYRRIGFVEEGVAREVHRTPEGGFRSMRLMSILAPEWKARV
jgi:RimJ/RimL family protein N-acetyltransferase